MQPEKDDSASKVSRVSHSAVAPELRGRGWRSSAAMTRSRSESCPDALPCAIRATHPDFFISQLPSPRNWAMAAGSNGYRVAPAAERGRSRMNRTTLKHKQKEIESWSAS